MMSINNISTLNMKITTTEAYDALHLMSLSFNVVVSICVLMNIMLQNSNITDISYMSAIARISIFSTNSISSLCMKYILSPFLNFIMQIYK